MRLAIDFNAKLGSIAIEIQHIGADGVLAPEPQPLSFATQSHPETRLRWRHPTAE
jgi:hypothetical protein